MPYALSATVTRNQQLHTLLLVGVACATMFGPANAAVRHAVKSPVPASENSDLRPTDRPAASKLEAQMAVILDQTVSPFGHEIARQLSTRWLLEDEPLPVSVTIRERPSPMRGSQIEMELGEKLIFSRRFQPRHADVETFSTQMSARLKDEILKRRLEPMVTSPDLASDGY